MESVTESQSEGPSSDASLVNVFSTPHSHNLHGGGYESKGPAGATIIDRPVKNCPIVPHYLPAELVPLSWLAGNWTGGPGVVSFPTMKKDFHYAERIEFTYSGQKMLDYKYGRVLEFYEVFLFTKRGNHFAG